MTDTSREAVEGLIAECRDVEGTNAWYEEVANTLAALLDERDAQFMLLNAQVRSLQEREQRIRDLEANLRRCGLRGEAKAIEWRDALERAERAEEQLQAIREVVTGWNGFTGLTREVLAILDTSGCWWEFEDGDRKFLPHERADNGACANCFAILADTNEGNGR